MAQAMAEATVIEGMGAVTGSIVGEDGARLDTALTEERKGALEESYGGFLSLIGQDFQVGQARSVIDADMDKLPARRTTGATDSSDAVADAVDAAQLLDVQVQELSGMFFLVASRWLGRIQSFESTQTPSGEDSGHSRASQIQTSGDLSRDHPPVSEFHNLIDHSGCRLPGAAMRPGGTIQQSLKPLLAIAGQPLVDGSLAHSQLSCHPDHRIAPLNSIYDQGSTVRATSCIVMNVHPISPLGAEGLSSNQHSRRSSDGQPLLLNNLLRVSGATQKRPVRAT
jgi:hypothetical protein